MMTLINDMATHADVAAMIICRLPAPPHVFDFQRSRHLTARHVCTFS